MRPSNSRLRESSAIWRISSPPGFVGRVRLAGEDEQHRALRVGNDLAQPVEVVEQQRGALVGGEAAGEADGQHRRIGRVGAAQDAVEVGLRALVAQVLLAHPAVHQVQQLGFQRLADAPEDLVGNALHAVPAALVGEAVLPAEAEVAVEGFVPVGGEEGRHVHRVGDVVHRVFGGGDLRPHVGADARGHVAVDARDAVVEARAAQGQRRHVEFAAATPPPTRPMPSRPSRSRPAALQNSPK
jgi:hypothetical protein